MSGPAIDVAGFEAKFQADPDPWNYAGSPFEAYKRTILRRACGSRLYGRGLELACANGETSKVLAPLCLKLLALDGSATAIAEARRRASHIANITFSRATLPDELPHRQFDLIVASEIFYYLDRHALDVLLDQLFHALAPGGRIVVLHHVINFNDTACPPAYAQQLANAYFGVHCSTVLDRSHGRFAVSAFDKPYR